MLTQASERCKVFDCEICKNVAATLRGAGSHGLNERDTYRRKDEHTWQYSMVSFRRIAWRDPLAAVRVHLVSDDHRDTGRSAVL